MRVTHYYLGLLGLAHSLKMVLSDAPLGAPPRLEPKPAEFGGRLSAAAEMILLRRTRTPGRALEHLLHTPNCSLHLHVGELATPATFTITSTFLFFIF